MQEKILVLASTSRRRIELLRRTGVEFIVVKPLAVEEVRDDPRETVLGNARRKALSVLEIVPPGSVVVAADTIVYSPVLGIIGKPRTLVEAREILWALRGKWHSVYTGVFIIDKDTLRYKSFIEETRVKMRNYTREELDTYLASMEPMGKAGAYAIQGLGGFLVESIVGDYNNVVGLPITRLYVELRGFGIDLLRTAVKKRVLGEEAGASRSIPY